jgi:UDP-N-acetylmuramoyl-L-alanyl-D-glutamate--2,6-diaminopimelate ligase
MSNRISEILEHVIYKIIVQECTDPINDVKTDSRTVKDGNVFIALQGEKLDGHNYIDEAYRNGAKYIIILHDMIQSISDRNYKGITIISVDDTRLCLPFIIDNLYSNPTQNFKLIGVTGTNGKTSVTTITKHVLMQMHYRVGLIGTINNYINNEILDIRQPLLLPLIVLSLV